MEFQEKIKNYLENSPPINETWNPNPEIHGYRFVDGFVCVKCAQRIMMRGCWGYLGRSEIAWSDSANPDFCVGCC